MFQLVHRKNKEVIGKKKLIKETHIINKTKRVRRKEDKEHRNQLQSKHS